MPIKFYDRKNELTMLEQNRVQSEKQSFFTLLVGRRRVGKTSLLMESVKGKKYLYLFVSRKNEQLLCAEFQQLAVDVLGLQIFGQTTQFKTLFEQLLIFSGINHFTLIIDEFQEFKNINPAVFSEMQHLWDKYKNDTRMHLIVCGSVYTLMHKIFEDAKEPLFGRIQSKIKLQPFHVDTLQQMLMDYSPQPQADDLLCLYMITGGVPRYVSLLLDAGAITKDLMLKYVTRVDSPFVSEGKDLLVSEFGKDYATYFSILQLIADGKTSQPEIDSVVGKNVGAYLVNLEKEYDFLQKRKPLFSKPGSRNNKWFINDLFLRFWFRFIYPHVYLYEMNKTHLLYEFLQIHYEQYSGYALERFFTDKIAITEEITGIGAWWDRKGENEIDLIALNSFAKKAIIAEIKRNTEKINPERLKAKAAFLSPYLNGYDVEYKMFGLQDVL